MTQLDAESYVRNFCVGAGLKYDRLMSPCRWQQYVDARQAIVFELRRCGWSQKRVGALLKRDHTSIINLERRPTPGKRATEKKQRGLHLWRKHDGPWIEDACDEVLA